MNFFKLKLLSRAVIRGLRSAFEASASDSEVPNLEHLKFEVCPACKLCSVKISGGPFWSKFEALKLRIEAHSASPETVSMKPGQNELLALRAPTSRRSSRTLSCRLI